MASKKKVTGKAKAKGWKAPRATILVFTAPLVEEETALQVDAELYQPLLEIITAGHNTGSVDKCEIKNDGFNAEIGSDSHSKSFLNGCLAVLGLFDLCATKPVQGLTASLKTVVEDIQGVMHDSYQGISLRVQKKGW